MDWQAIAVAAVCVAAVLFAMSRIVRRIRGGGDACSGCCDGSCPRRRNEEK